mgnify:CR=1 FL=1
MRETNFLAWTKHIYGPTSSKISDFEIDGITFEVEGKNKNGTQIKDAKTGYLVKDNLGYAFGNSIPIWMFGFLCRHSFATLYFRMNKSVADGDRF